jgi:hypothetical protein
MSKQPLVNTTFFPKKFHKARLRGKSATSIIFASVACV